MKIPAFFSLTKAQREQIAPEDFAGPDQSYPCDTQEHLDACAKLLGKAPADEQNEIKARAMKIAKRKGLTLPESWKEDAAMGSALSESADLDAAEFGANTATFSGPVFKAGSYPLQKITMTPEDNLAACKDFKPVPIKDTHDEGQSVFAGRLGQWESASSDDNGETVKAKLSLPSALVSLFGKDWRPKVSVEIDRSTKKFTAIALLNYPQVTEAQIQAAFAGARHSKDDMSHVQAIHDHAAKLGAQCAATMGARHSAADLEAIQQMHDLSVSQGATCPMAADENPGAPFGAHDPAGVTPMAKEKPMKEWEKLVSRFGADALAKAGITQAKFEEADMPFSTPSDSALAEQLAKFEAERAMFHARALNEEAAKFANDVVYTQKKALVAQLPQIKEMYVTAANADGKNGVASFSSTGAIEEGDKVKALRDYFNAAPTLALFHEHIEGTKPDDKETSRQQRTANRLLENRKRYGGN